ncbi:leucine-rich repeat protein [Treponema sp. OMZ 788]|uniref:leucine-rich repeat protein n=1 Tax=Treponema sp. OMZ 788 TaxID=2563664 RepID=UPI0020A5DF87|nr:leucine-rich repeat protein [Treponema sp. OMZ 788]UTC64136.1 leucine-rich repeat protein [Treponema sp. OMZ 788]
MKCKVCGFRLADGTAKCPICGAMPGSTKAGNIAEDVNLPRYFCPSCKTEIIGEHRYCPSCMKDLSQTIKKAEVQESAGSKCVQCGALLPMNAKFCHKCGAKQDNNCPHCGAILLHNATFCNECGAKQEALSSVKATKDNAPNVSAGLKETPLEAFKYKVRNGKYILTRVKDTFFTDIVIPSVFSTIDSKAFSGCRGLTSITIPNSVTEIDERAFENCSGLTSITIPNSVTQIGDYTFYKCTGLKSITIPNSVTKIGKSAFASCNGLKSITIPYSVTEIGDYTFVGCSSLKSITIPYSVTKIGENAFSSCTCLTSITIPSSVTQIGDYAFYKCYSLKYVSIENNRFRESDIARIFGDSPNFTKIKIGNKW